MFNGIKCGSPCIISNGYEPVGIGFIQIQLGRPLITVWKDNYVVPEGAFNWSKCAPGECLRKSTKETGEQRSSMSPEASEDSLPKKCFWAKDHPTVPATFGSKHLHPNIFDHLATRSTEAQNLQLYLSGQLPLAHNRLQVLLKVQQSS